MSVAYSPTVQQQQQQQQPQPHQAPLPQNQQQYRGGPPNRPPNNAPPASPAHIQKILDENCGLIQTIQDFQNLGKINECMTYHQALHRNLVYLAQLADSTQNIAQILPPPHVLQSGTGHQQMAPHHPGLSAPPSANPINICEPGILPAPNIFKADGGPPPSQPPLSNYNHQTQPQMPPQPPQVGPISFCRILILKQRIFWSRLFFFVSRRAHYPLYAFVRHEVSQKHISITGTASCTATSSTGRPSSIRYRNDNR